MKYLLIAGARPNFIMKIAPSWRSFSDRDRYELLLVHTGEHYSRNMSEEFFRELGIPEPDINLKMGSGSHAGQTARVMMAFESLCMEHRPDWVVLVMDVNSTLASALTAKKLGIRVAHVEAGLRSRDLAGVVLALKEALPEYNPSGELLRRIVPVQAAAAAG